LPTSFRDKITGINVEEDEITGVVEPKQEKNKDKIESNEELINDDVLQQNKKNYDALLNLADLKIDNDDEDEDLDLKNMSNFHNSDSSKFITLMNIYRKFEYK